MSAIWNCKDTAAGMDAYRAGQLSESMTDQLLEHALRCPYCHAHHWMPFVEEASWMADALIDEMLGFEPAQDGLDVMARQTFGGTSSDEGSWDDAPLDNSSLGTQFIGHDLDHAETETGKTIKCSSSHLKQRSGAASRLNTDEVDSHPRLESGPGVRLQHIGTVLPRVPKPDLLRGYYWYLGAGAPRPEPDARTTARLWVEADGGSHWVYVEALGVGVMFDGRLLTLGQKVLLRWTRLIECGPWRYLFESTEGVDTAWRGAGVLRHVGPTWPLSADRTLVGRDREACAIPLRDHSSRANLEWRPGCRRVAEMTLDSVDVSREHAELVRSKDGLELRACGNRPAYRLRAGVVSSTRAGEAALTIVQGDACRIGNQLFEYREDLPYKKAAT